MVFVVVLINPKMTRDTSPIRLIYTHRLVAIEIDNKFKARNRILRSTRDWTGFLWFANRNSRYVALRTLCATSHCTRSGTILAKLYSIRDTIAYPTIEMAHTNQGIIDIMFVVFWFVFLPVHQSLEILEERLCLRLSLPQLKILHR